MLFGQTSTKIIGGESIDISEAPWQISLEINGNHSCGGVILNEEWVLTAAHCILSLDASIYTVHAGATDQTDNSVGQRVLVSQVTRHPEWNNFDQLGVFDGYDLALLKLSTPLCFDENVQSIKYATPENCTLDNLAIGTLGLLTGWGATSPNTAEPASSSVLRKIHIPIISRDEAFYLMGQPEGVGGYNACYESDGPLNNLMLPFYHSDMSTGGGDSGGPAVISVVGEPMLVGITSWGGCAGNGWEIFPSVFANVREMSDFITAGISSTRTITENETWNATLGEIRISDKIIIEDGATLTIESNVEVQFAEEARLIIKPNARLILHGKLTSISTYCEEKPWKGVEVWGNSNLSQYSVNGMRGQGRLECRPGSIIENATTAVQLWGSDEEFDAGGQISCQNMTFRNNQIAVDFAPYNNFYPFSWNPNWYLQPRNYSARFISCSFETNNDYLVEYPFETFVRMRGVNGVSFSGCDFINTQTVSSANQIESYGFGIQATNSGFGVTGKCTTNTYPCASYIRSNFQGLGIAIFNSTTAGAKTFKVKQTDFENCYVGIRNEAGSNAILLFNKFNFGSLPDTDVTTNQIGIAFQGNISGFTCEENEFIGNSSSSLSQVGTLCNGINYFNNVFRNNTFSNLTFGNVAIGNNGELGLFDRGLHYLCNKNTGNFTDFGVGSTFGNDRIRKSQGLETEIGPVITYLAAGNTFSSLNTSKHFINHGTEIDYYAFLDSNIQIPTAIEGSALFNVLEAQENTCPETYCEPPCLSQSGLVNQKAEYYQDKEKETTAKIEREVAIAAGDANLAAQKEKAAEYYRTEMDKKAYLVVVHQLHDTLTFKEDSLTRWIENLDIFSMDMFWSLKQQSNGNTAVAQTFLQRASQRNNLNEVEKNDLRLMPELLQILDRKSPYYLETDDLKRLEKLSEEKVGFVGNVSRNILGMYGYYFPLEYTLPHTKQTDFPTELPIKKVKDTFLQPNPNEGQFTFLWKPVNTENNEAQLKITDITGKVIEIITIDAFEKVNVDLHNQQQGLYFYQLETKQQVLQTGKFIIK